MKVEIIEMRKAKNFELISWALFFFSYVVYLLLASLVGKEQKKTNFDGFFCCHQKNHRRKQQKHKKVSHFGSRSRVLMALQWPSNVEQPSYFVCQPTPLSHSEAKKREKVEKVLEHVFLSGGRGREAGNVRRREWNSSKLCSHSMKLNNEEFSRGMP